MNSKKLVKIDTTKNKNQGAQRYVGQITHIFFNKKRGVKKSQPRLSIVSKKASQLRLLFFYQKTKDPTNQCQIAKLLQVQEPKLELQQHRQAP